jgi:hypothetical protein
MAYRRGETSDEAFVGALIEADGFHALRTLRGFLTALGKGRG